jgi:hypothetical protein
MSPISVLPNSDVPFVSEADFDPFDHIIDNERVA